MNPVRQLKPLAFPEKEDRVVSRDVTPAQSSNPDLLRLPQPFATKDRLLSGRNRRAHQGSRGTRRRIALHAMVNLHNFDVKSATSGLLRLLNHKRQNSRPERRVWRNSDRHFLSYSLNSLGLLRRVPGRCDQERHPQLGALLGNRH